MENLDNQSHSYLFTGAIENKIDSQRRIAVPSDWREENPSGIFVIMPGCDSTLQIYPLDVYNARYANVLTPQNSVNKSIQTRQRYLFSLTLKVRCDKQGRIQLTQKLLEYANIKDEVAFIGFGSFGQMMDANLWHKEESKMSENGDDFLDILG